MSVAGLGHLNLASSTTSLSADPPLHSVSAGTGIKPRASCILVNTLPAELHPQNLEKTFRSAKNYAFDVSSLWFSRQ